MLSCAAPPLHRQALELTVLVRRLDVHERMGVTEHELEQLAFDLYRAVFEVGRREGMVRLHRHARDHREQGRRQDQLEDRSHALNSPFWRPPGSGTHRSATMAIMASEAPPRTAENTEGFGSTERKT